MPSGAYGVGSYGGNYDANSVGGDSPGVYSSGGGGGSGGFDQTPSVGNYGGGAGSYAGGQGDAGGGGSGGGAANANMWIALFQGIGDKLNSRFQAGNVADAARAAIPSAAYGNALRGQIDQMAPEGAMLAASKLGPRAKASAVALAQRSAEARGLQGPLAANLEQDSVNDAQSNYDQWRMGALNSYRQNYLSLVNQYYQALEQRRQAIIKSNAANREAFWAKVPVGPIGEAVGKGFNWDSGAYTSTPVNYNDPTVASF